MAVDGSTEVPAKTLAECLGLTPMRVQQLVKEGVIKRTAKGKFPLMAGIAAYVAWLKEDQRKASKSASTGRMTDARVADLELRMEERRGALRAAAEETALATCDRVLGEFRVDIYSIPARVTADIALRQALEHQFDEAFRSAATRAAVRSNGKPVDRQPVRTGGTAKPRSVGRGKPKVPAKRGRSRST